MAEQTELIERLSFVALIPTTDVAKVLSALDACGYEVVKRMPTPVVFGDGCLPRPEVTYGGEGIVRVTKP